MDLYKSAAALPHTLDPGRRVLTARDVPRALRQAMTRRSRRGVVHRPVRGAYLFGKAQPTIVEDVKAALAVSPRDAVAGFHTAAALLGFGVPASSFIHLVVPAGGLFPQRREIRIHRSVVPFEPVDVLGVPCTPAARTAIDLARVLTRIEALPVLDAALYALACTADDLTLEALKIAGFRGARQAKELALLADPRPQCRQESQLRLILVDGGLFDFVPQLLVTDGIRKHYLDLGNEALRVGAEYDGSSHLNQARLRADRARHNFLEGLRWRMRYFTAHDIYRAPQAIVPTIRRAAAS